MRVVALLFLVKALILAFFVTPLWDVPDESGHYSTVQDLADGKGLPLAGKSVVPSNVLARWMRARSEPEPALNWVAQHPPLYHLLAVPFLQAARAITENPEWRFRAPRVLSALAGAAALLLMFHALREASDDAVASFAATAAVSFLPMYSHLSSGTNHDTFLALTAGAAALFWVRLLRGGHFSDGLKMGTALAIAGAVKLSALPVSAALLSLSWRPLTARDGPRRLAKWLAIAAVSVSLPFLWGLRHWWLLRNTRIHPTSGEAFRLSDFLTYLHDYPVMDHTVKNFFGLIGWTGTGGGQVRWFQISGAFLLPLLLLASTVAAAAAWWLLCAESNSIRWIAVVPAGLTFAFCFFWLFSQEVGASLLKRVVYSLFAAVPFLALPLLFRKNDPARGETLQKFVAGSQLVFLVFGLAYLVNSWQAYKIYGQMRATHGRYFFAVLPFLVLGFLLPATRLARKTARRNLVLSIAVAALFVNETLFFLLRVIPFYRSGPFS